MQLPPLTGADPAEARAAVIAAIAAQLGHRDGGKLVRTNYGHPDARIARDKVREAYRSRPPAPRPLVAAAK